MRNKKVRCVCLIFSFALIVSVPRILNYQGKLLETSGVGVNDTISMTFKLYATEEGGSPLWSKTINNIVVRNGLFSVELSDFPDSLDFSTQYWLEISVAEETLRPRERLTASPYSLYSERSQKTKQALQSIYTNEDFTRRYGNLMLRASEGATMSDLGDSIIIIIGSTSSIPSLAQVLASGRVAGTNIDMDGFRLINLGTPINNSDAATKEYVDTHISPSDWLLIMNKEYGAGKGLHFAGDSFNVNVDGSTVVIVNDTIKLASTAISSSTIADSSILFVDLSPDLPDSFLAYGGIDLTYTASESINYLDAVYLGSPLAGWYYRQPVYISSVGSQLTNYAVKIVITSANSSFWSHRASGLNGADVRFTLADGSTVLSHYQQSWSDGVRAIFWVKIPTIPASGGTSIYLYYGNPTASSVSNGANTFDLFEDFEGESISSLEAAGWSKKYTTNTSYASPPTYAIETDGTSVLHISNPYSYGHYGWFWLPGSYSDGSLMFMFKILEEGTSGAQRQVHPVIRMDPASWFETGSANRHHIWTYKAYATSYNDTWSVIKWEDQTQTTLGSGSYDFSNLIWYICEFRAYGNRIEYLLNDSLIYSGTDTRYTTGKWGPGEYESHIHFDNVIFRKFVYPEPSVSFGSEEFVDEGLYRAFASNASVIENFIGFALNSGSAGTTIRVRIAGVVSGFSALERGSNYYLTNTPGLISRTPGTFVKRVGIAISPNKMLITR